MEAEGRTVLDGRYQLWEVIGRGSYATVYSATDLETDRHYAIKVLSEGLSRARLQRFQNESSLLLSTRHPHLVAAHATGVWEGRPYLVLDLIRGGSLRDRREFEGPLPWEAVAGPMVEVLAALAMVHHRGLIHRDVKPANILVDENGTAFLCDFGIAHVEGGVKLTQTGSTLGTALYMAPEQRLDPRRVDLTTDIYAVGTTIFRLLSPESAIDLFALPADAARWNSLPPALRPVIQKSTHLDHAQRYPDASAMAEALLRASPPPLRNQIVSRSTCDPAQFPAPDPRIRPPPPPPPPGLWERLRRLLD